MPESKLFIIPAESSDLHRLDIQRIGNLFYISTNNRKIYEKWTLAWDEGMARQLISGLTAVLSGAYRACTQMQLNLEANQRKLEDAARAQNRPAPPPDLSTYDDLFREG